MNFDYPCPHCKRVLTLDQRFIGIEGLCPFCRNRFKVEPRVPGAQPALQGAGSDRPRPSARRAMPGVSLRTPGSRRGSTRPGRGFDDEVEEAGADRGGKGPARKKDPMVFVIGGIAAVVLLVGVILLATSGRNPAGGAGNTPASAGSAPTSVTPPGPAEAAPAPTPSPGTDGKSGGGILGRGEPGQGLTPAGGAAIPKPPTVAPGPTVTPPEKPAPKPGPTTTDPARPVSPPAAGADKKKVPCQMCEGTGKRGGKPCNGPCGGTGSFELR